MIFFFSQAKYLSYQICMFACSWSLIFRTFMVLYAQGFIYNGKIHLRLFHQLYWLNVIIYSLIAFGMFPLPLLIKGEFPNESTSGKVCLQIQLEHTEDILKKNGIGIFTFFSATFIMFYFKSKVNRYIKGVCPNQKMSCIGKYKRNFLNYNQDMMHAFAWQTISVLDICVLPLYSNYNLSPTLVSYVDVLTLVLIKEIWLLLTSLVWANREIPVSNEVPRRIKFYVLGED